MSPGLSLDSLVYLTQAYWPFLAGALVVGLVTGWFSYRPRRQR